MYFAMHPQVHVSEPNNVLTDPDRNSAGHDERLEILSREIWFQYSEYDNGTRTYSRMVPYEFAHEIVGLAKGGAVAATF